jgi:hypothetical protein
MSYKLVYVTDEATATIRNNDPKALRDIIKMLKDSKAKCKWGLFNDGGIKLDSSEEQEAEEKLNKEKKRGKKDMS